MAMIPWSPALLDRGIPGKQNGSFVNSIFVSAATNAAKMIAAAAAATSAEVVSTGERGERWRAVDHVRYLVMLTIWANAWVLRILTVASASSSSSSPVIFLLDSDVDRFVVKRSTAAGSSSSAIVVQGERGRELGGRPASTTAIGRALAHVLDIMNDVPATSRKYEYVMATADRIVTENTQVGHAALLEVTRTALSAAFSRTCDRLRRSLERSEASTASWPSRLIRAIPMGDRLAAACYDRIRPYLGLLPLPLPDGGAWREDGHRQPEATRAASSSVEWLESEKLALELLWIANKLRACSASDEAIARWAFASDLASLALTAHPRVQSAMVKLTVMVYRELGRGKWEAAREVQFGVLALWLPLLCYASNGVTSPVLVGTERWEMEKVMEELIAGLPWEDQEIVLRNWLDDFAAADSDWPNLQRSFDRWCRHSRKLLLSDAPR